MEEQNNSCAPQGSSGTAAEKPEEAQDAGGRGKQPSKRWSEAGRKVTTLLSLSRGFKTLRDQYAENWVHPEELEKIKSLGEGAFAKVELCYYRPRATHADNSSKAPPARIVAVKSLKPEVIGGSQDEINAFLTEVALMRKLKHKHIVAYVGMGSHSKGEMNSMFLVEEALPGGSAKKLVIRQMRQLHTRVYTYADALRWSQQVADGMAYLHACQPQVIHRDLKLENILLRGETASTSTAKIADFGLSALVKKRLLGEVVRASKHHVEVSNQTGDRSRRSPSQQAHGPSKGKRGPTGRRKRAAKGGGSVALSPTDPAVLQTRWNMNFQGLARKVLAAEQDPGVVDRVQSRLTSLPSMQARQATVGAMPWHGGHPNLEYSLLSSDPSVNNGGQGGEGSHHSGTAGPGHLDVAAHHKVEAPSKEDSSVDKAHRHSPFQGTGNTKLPPHQGPLDEGLATIREREERESSFSHSNIPCLPSISAHPSADACPASPPRHIHRLPSMSPHPSADACPSSPLRNILRLPSISPRPSADACLTSPPKSLHKNSRTGVSPPRSHTSHLESTRDPETAAAAAAAAAAGGGKMGMAFTHSHAPASHSDKTHEPGKAAAAAAAGSNHHAQPYAATAAAGQNHRAQPQAAAAAAAAATAAGHNHHIQPQAAAAAGSNHHTQPQATAASGGNHHTQPQVASGGNHRAQPQAVAQRLQQRTQHHAGTPRQQHSSSTTATQHQAGAPMATQRQHHAGAPQQQQHNNTTATQLQRHGGAPQQQNNNDATATQRQHHAAAPQQQVNNNNTPATHQQHSNKITATQQQRSNPTATQEQHKPQPTPFLPPLQPSPRVSKDTPPHLLTQLTSIAADPHAHESRPSSQPDQIYGDKGGPQAPHLGALSSSGVLVDVRTSGRSGLGGSVEGNSGSEESSWARMSKRSVQGGSTEGNAGSEEKSWARLSFRQVAQEGQPLALQLDPQPAANSPRRYLLQQQQQQQQQADSEETTPPPPFDREQLMSLRRASGRSMVTRNPSSLRVRVTSDSGRIAEGDDVEDEGQGASITTPDVPGLVGVGSPKVADEQAQPPSAGAPTMHDHTQHHELASLHINPIADSERSYTHIPATLPSAAILDPESSSESHRSRTHYSGVLHPPKPVHEDPHDHASPLQNPCQGSSHHGPHTLHEHSNSQKLKYGKQESKLGNSQKLTKQDSKKHGSGKHEGTGSGHKLGSGGHRVEGGVHKLANHKGTPGRNKKRRQRIATELREVVDEHVQLSGRTGTLCYMSPEVYRSEHYNEKSDVFSFGVILFELFHRFLVVYGIAPSGNHGDVEQYAAQVSQGYRPPLSMHIPYSLGALIRACGAQDPEARPTMAVVLQRLKEIEAQGVVAKMDEPPEVPRARCECCAVM